MILAAEYARKNKIPYFGLCFGVQILAIAFARYVLGLEDANSTEMNPKTKNPVITTMADQVEKIKNKQYGATMRLGAYPAVLIKDSLSRRAYGTIEISERHRHRYEFNNKYREDFEKNGLKIAGINKELNLVEIAEVKDHPWMLGTQFHPEFKSRPLAPHPLFREFIKAAIRKSR
jgi:CTP synthase